MAWRTKEEVGREEMGGSSQLIMLNSQSQDLQAAHYDLRAFLAAPSCSPPLAAAPILDKARANRGNLLLFLVRAVPECRVLLSLLPAHLPHTAPSHLSKCLSDFGLRPLYFVHDGTLVSVLEGAPWTLLNISPLLLPLASR